MVGKAESDSIFKVMSRHTRSRLLSLYDRPDPTMQDSVIKGYDKDHAERTTRIVLMAAQDIGIREPYMPGLEVASLLHDIGRAGMKPQLFGQIFNLARELGLPVRITELRSRYPYVRDEQAAEFFLRLIRPALEAKGIRITPEVVDHISMRMNYKGRMRDVLAQSSSELQRMGIAIRPWMEAVMLYYYYPEDMKGQPEDVKLMGMLLVACENFEAYNNLRRGRDYYGRREELLRDAFRTIERFRDEGLITDQVLNILRELTVSGRLDSIIKESRGLLPEAVLPNDDVAFKMELASLLKR